ncbi:hypothetical protein J7U46_10735 [Pelomonas sp. V22]|uniref:hypothetical protein n=1 Tax=Pelomonas sp. V22 TaxID=2822139 RepID=UPI0024A8F318|nr:hypothetical protein [Pelomonas sp. V22]MDI4633523.1 hypothetical protein [Pelomonas sp. V22]
MSPLLPTSAGSSGDALGARAVAPRTDESTARKAAAAEPGVAPAAVASAASAGVQTSFSAESLRALEDSALAIAGEVKGLVTGVGQAGADLIGGAADAIDAVGESAIHLVNTGADNLVKGISSVRSSVGEVADAVEGAVTDAAGRAGDAVESAVGYAALAALAGGALIDVLA